MLNQDTKFQEFNTEIFTQIDFDADTKCFFVAHMFVYVEII